MNLQRFAKAERIRKRDPKVRSTSMLRDVCLWQAVHNSVGKTADLLPTRPPESANSSLKERSKG